MTKRIAIVNLSNCDGEDYIVRAEGTEYKIRPGEHCNVTWGQDVDVQLRYVEADSVQPFYLASGHGKLKAMSQTWPYMNIEWNSDRGQVMMGTPMSETESDE